MVVERSVS